MESDACAKNKGLLPQEQGMIDTGGEGSARDDLQEQGLTVKQREVKGVEANHAIKCANTTVKRKIDQHKEAMLGKKRNRRTMFLNLEDVKQASTIMTSTPRRQNLAQPVITRSREVNAPAEHGGDIQSHGLYRDQKSIDFPSNGGIHPEPAEQKFKSNGESDSDLLGKPRRLKRDEGPAADGMGTSVSRQASWKQPKNLRQPKSGHSSSRKVSYRHNSFRKPATTSTQYQDTTVERLIREVTNEKFWRHPENTELRSVPKRFESMEEYVRVFEPLLFEECRAQLYSTWEELAEANAYVKVRIKSIERRERGNWP